jgi:serine/threonine protein kinase
MSKNKDTTNIKNSGTVRLGSGETIRIDETINLSAQTEKVDGKVIRSGFGGSIAAEHTKDNLYRFNKKEYRLIKKISESTSEAQIFLIERNEEQFILKYYYPFVKPKIDLIKKIRKFKHPDIIRVIDYGYFEDRFFEILEYADQGSLADNLPVNDIKLIKKFIGEIIEALNYCHQNGIIHRDIKPSNIFLKDKKEKDILIGDFGIASLIDEGELFRRTNIFQTPIYAAPEYRMNLRGETFITKAVDYYALGITVWEISSNEVPPNGMDDLEFLRLMFEGNPPLPGGMDDDIAYLIKGLTLRDHKLRWGYAEVGQWLNDEAPDIITEPEPEYTNGFDFGTDGNGKRLSASSPEQLAKLINDYPETGRKHLYRGTVKEWLKEQGDKKLYVEIADVTDYKFKNDEQTGTAFAVYVLDRDFPYTGINGKAYKSKKEIISALDENIVEYRKLLTNPNDKLYLYLLSKNAVAEVEKYRSYFERYEKELAIYYVIYDLRFSIEKNVPYYHPKKDDSISFDSLQDLAGYLFDHPDEATDIMRGNKFHVWLNFMNPGIFEKFNDAVNEYTLESETLPKLLPYILDPERGYEGLSGNMCYNLIDLAKEFDEHFHKYKKILKNKDARIYTFLEMNSYEGEAEFCFEIFNMKNAAWRTSPFNDNTALMKIIRGFGFTPVLYINKKEDGKSVDRVAIHKPGDLYEKRKHIEKELEKDLNNLDSITIAWISIFFHEYPLNKEETMLMYGSEDFDNRLKKFIGFFVEYFPDTEIAKRNKEAQEKAAKIKSEFISGGGWNKVLLATGMLLPLIAGLLLLAYSYFSPEIYLPKSIFSVTIWYFVIVAGAVVLFFFASDDMSESFSTSFFGGGILGLIIATVLYFLFKLIVGTPLLLLLLLTTGFYFYYRFLFKVYNTLKSYQDEENLFINTYETDRLVELYTFNKIDDMEIKQTGGLKELKSEIRYKVFFIIGYTVAVTILLSGILFLLLYHDPHLK